MGCFESDNQWKLFGVYLYMAKLVTVSKKPRPCKDIHFPTELPVDFIECFNIDGAIWLQSVLQLCSMRKQSDRMHGSFQKLIQLA